jgi:transcriptional regulator of acetoin/glycerol metabolism
MFGYQRTKGESEVKTIIRNRYDLFSTWEQAQISKVWQNSHLSQEIRESWERSKRYGVDPFKPLNNQILDENALRQRIEANRDLLAIAIPVMEDLYSITKGSNFCVAITDNEGYILKRIGDQEELDFTGYSNFIEGANWAEEAIGTNAVGLALVLDKPNQVFGYEHFCVCAITSTCSAAPIHDTEGNIIGVLDLTGPYKLVNAHTLGMVVACVKAIERTMELNKIYNEAKLANIHKEAIMESMSEGLIAVNETGCITHINHWAKKLLEINPIKSSSRKLRDIMETENPHFFNVIGSGRCVYGQAVVVRTKTGKKRFIVSCTPLRDQNDETIKGAVIVFHEMSKVVNKIVGAKAQITFDHLIGNNRNFRFAVEQAKMAAKTDTNILLLGESGVGKDMFAQAIHNASNRSQEAFFAINCAAIPRELIASELFGYDEGAFTGARKGGNPGKFELADRGTIFLDEIAEMPLDLQASLLRVLEEKTVIRVGGREFIPIDVRIISATNKNLQEEIQKGNFRHDLFFRLGVMPIEIPPLRQRKDDIQAMVDHFLNNICLKIGKTICKVDEEALDILMAYDYPGNVRELRNILERAINLAKGDVLTADLLPAELVNASKKPSLLSFTKEPSKDDLEEQLIRNYLSKYFNNKTEVAKVMGISRSTLYRKMKKFNI